MDSQDTSRDAEEVLAPIVSGLAAMGAQSDWSPPKTVQELREDLKKFGNILHQVSVINGENLISWTEEPMSSDEEDAEDLVEDFDRWASFDEVYSVAVNHILTLKQERNNRTGVNTLSDGSMFIELDLRKGFPLLSSKKIFLRGVAEELFWFISGMTRSF